jgi:hypothetical protein
MHDPRIIHIEHISQDPLMGRVSGTVVCRQPDGDLSRMRLSVPLRRASLPHCEAEAQLRREALAREPSRG